MVYSRDEGVEATLVKAEELPISEPEEEPFMMAVIDSGGGA